jgi:hypothetical protein
MKAKLKLNSSQDGLVFSTDGDVQTLSAGHGNVPKILINDMDITYRKTDSTDNSGGGEK